MTILVIASDSDSCENGTGINVEKAVYNVASCQNATDIIAFIITLTINLGPGGRCRPGCCPACPPSYQVKAKPTPALLILHDTPD